MGKKGKGTDKRLFAGVMIVSTLLGGAGQLFFKLGLAEYGLPVDLVLYLSIGAFAYAVSTILYFYVLGRSHLSWAYGFVGLSYLFAAIFAAFILGEQISAARWAGVLMIVAGVAFIGLS
jgi:drug/metabolite transporter (DMT)-like permease